MERFSDRHGYRGTEPEITGREDAPEGLRFAIPLIAQDARMSPGAMRKTICAVLLVRPDPANWSEYPNIWDEVNRLSTIARGSRSMTSLKRSMPRSRRSTQTEPTSFRIG